MRRTIELPGRASGEPLSAVRLGVRGPVLAYFASSGGDESEFERFGMQRVAAPWLGAGRLQVVAVDARGPRTFWDDACAPAERIARYAALHDDLLDSLLPYLHGLSGESRLTVAGASYGAHVAANLWLDRPAEIVAVGGFGGVYGLRHRLPGVDDPRVARLTPLERLASLDDPAARRALRETEGLAIYAAADDGWLPSSLATAGELVGSSIPHSLNVWPGPADHHERWWRDQLPRFLRRRFGAP